MYVYNIIIIMGQMVLLLLFRELYMYPENHFWKLKIFSTLTKEMLAISFGYDQI